MPLIMNCTSDTQTVIVFGNYFTLKPGQIKSFQDNIAHFMAVDRADFGLVSLPEEFEDMDYRASEEGKKKLLELRQNGVNNRIRKLKEIIWNNQVSLRRDLEQANIKADPAVFASDGEIAAMKELASYQRALDDESQKKAQEVKELLGQIGKIEN